MTGVVFALIVTYNEHSRGLAVTSVTSVTYVRAKGPTREPGPKARFDPRTLTWIGCCFPAWSGTVAPWSYYPLQATIPSTRSR